MFELRRPLHRGIHVARTACGWISRLSILAVGLSLVAPLYPAMAADEVSVAFLGDQGIGDNARAVLQLVKNEDVDLLLLQGDLGYDGQARDWIALFESVFPGDFPVLSSAGNHDRVEWATYRSWLDRRIDAAPDVDCSGDTGVKAHCRFRGLSVVQIAPGIRDVSPVGLNDDYKGYIDARFDDNASAWRICSFHKVQTAMQVGDQRDSVGWGVYEACLRAGAIVATAHEHSYARTFLMQSFQQQQVANREATLVLEPGRSFAFHAGLGGHDVRAQEFGGDWWASIYTASQGADHGALFCRFGETTARCEFKSINGAVPDTFSIETRVGRGGEGAVASVSPDVEPDLADDPVNVEAVETDEDTAEPDADAQNDPALAAQFLTGPESEDELAIAMSDANESDDASATDVADPDPAQQSAVIDPAQEPSASVDDTVSDQVIEPAASPEADGGDDVEDPVMPVAATASDIVDADASSTGNPFAVATSDSGSAASDTVVPGDGRVRTGAIGTGFLIALMLTGMRRRALFWYRFS